MYAEAIVTQYADDGNKNGCVLNITTLYAFNVDSLTAEKMIITKTVSNIKYSNDTLSVRVSTDSQ